MKVNKLNKIFIILIVFLFVVVGFLSYESYIQTKNNKHMESYIYKEINAMNNLSMELDRLNCTLDKLNKEK